MTTEPAVARFARASVPHSPAARAETGELILYWRAIAKRKWWILVSGIVLAALAFFAASLATPAYRATATLMIEQNKTKLVSIEEVYSGVSPNREHYQTQTEMLKLPVIARRVIDRLRLDEHPDFDPRQRAPGLLGKTLGLDDTRERSSWTTEKVQAAVLSEFLRRVTVEPVRATQLVHLSFDATERELAARIANSIAEVYIESDIEARSAITERAGDWLSERLTSLKQNLEQSERALQQYREQQGLVDTKGLAQSGATKQIEELTRALNEASQRRIDAENTFKQLTSGRGKADSSPVVLRTGHIDRLKELESTAEKNYAAAANRYGPEHPRMILADRQLREARRNTQQAIESLVASFAKEYEVAAADEAATRAALITAKGSVRDINRKEFQLDALEQDVATNRQIYDKFLNRYRETRATSDTQTNVVARIIDPAVAPKEVYKPRSERIAQFAFVLGILLAAVAALVRDRLDSTLRSAQDIQERIGLPSIAILPRLRSRERKKAGRHYVEQPKSVFAEGIRTARTSILLSAIDQQNKALLVTSSVPDEGKSSFAANLALAHAEGRKTLLIEADLRRPSLAGQLEIANDGPGLVQVLSGTASLGESIQRVPGSSLYVLPAGSPAENALEILSSAAFAEILQRLTTACDIVIIDSPPVHLVSDAVVLSQLVTSVLFVVKAGATPYPLVRRSVRTLRDAGANVLGIALNGLDFQKADDYYNAYTRYAREYGAYYGKAS
jgi:polysaccharide biosynthesis transport protein